MKAPGIRLGPTGVALAVETTRPMRLYRLDVDGPATSTSRWCSRSWCDSISGFSEPASFTRQFCTWAGTTPSSYRDRHKGDAGLVAAATALLVERRAP